MTRKRFLFGTALLMFCLCAIAAVIFIKATPTGRLHIIQEQIYIKYKTVEHLDTASLAADISERTSTKMIILDVRSKEEYDISHIKTARLIDPDLDPAIALAGVSKDAEIVVYCSVGYRSSDYARKLQLNQYRHVYNLDGSIFKWANEGRPLFDEYKQVTVVHPYNAEWGLLLQPQYRADLNAVKK